MTIPGGTTVIGNTRFNPFYGIYPQEIPPTTQNDPDIEIWQGHIVANTSEDISGSSMNVTQDLINEALFNITLSVITEYGWWNTTDTIVIITKTINIYSFSQPLNLIIPYFLTLLLAIPILEIGAFALLKNGVSVTDGGFLRIVTTTTRSPTLEKLAASACLGGSESIPSELKDLEIRFGELVGVGAGGIEGVRKAGFGSSDETVPLMKGMVYGA